MTICIFISMYLLLIMTKKIMVNDSHSQPTVFIYNDDFVAVTQLYGHLEKPQNI